jgi:transposase InsO family protein
VKQKNDRPNHPPDQSKVERFQQTLKKWLAAQSPQPVDLAELQAQLDAFTACYNQYRPHRSLHAPSPCATTGGSTTSASAEPTSCC